MVSINMSAVLEESIRKALPSVPVLVEELRNVRADETYYVIQLDYGWKYEYTLYLEQIILDGIRLSVRAITEIYKILYLHPTILTLHQCYLL